MFGTATDILCVDIITIIHVITQVQPSALPWLGPVLLGAEVSSLLPMCP